MTLSPRLFQDAHVPDLPFEFCPASGSGSAPSFFAASVPSDGLPLLHATVVRVLQALTKES